MTTKVFCKDCHQLNSGETENCEYCGSPLPKLAKPEPRIVVQKTIVQKPTVMGVIQQTPAQQTPAKIQSEEEFHNKPLNVENMMLDDFNDPA